MIYDAIIIGGGPAGAACATVLSQAGLAVMLCERACFPRARICGDCVNPRAWKLFDLLDVSEDIRALPLGRLRMITVSACQHNPITVEPDTPSNQPFFAVKRALLDHVFLRRAESVGANVQEETHVGAVDWDDCWYAHVRQGRDARSSVFKGRVLVGADGRNSLVGKTLAKQTSGGRQSARVGIQWLARKQTLPETVAMFLFNTGYAGVVNLDNHCSNIAMTTTPDAAQLALTDFDAFANTTLFSNAAARQTLDSINPLGEIATTFPINPVVRAVLPGAVFLAGDARRTLEPFTGEGVCFALNDGVRTAAEVLRLFGKESVCQAPYRQSAWWPNHLFSQILRSDRLTDAAITMAARFPEMVPWLVRAVF